ncbi:MAG: hypothetical protein AB8B55_22125 [Mariniblastus sp.]
MDRTTKTVSTIRLRFTNAVLNSEDGTLIQNDSHKLWIFSFVIFFSMLQAFSSASAFQRISDEQLNKMLTTQKCVLLFVRETNGALVVREDEPTPLSVRHFFDHETISEDLGLEENAVAKIKAMGKELEKTKHELGKKLLKVRITNEEEIASHKNELEKAQNEFISKCLSELSNRQQARLREIQFRFLISRNGLLYLLNHPATSDYFDVKKGRSIELGFDRKKVAQDLLEQELAITKEALDVWLAELTSKQRELFDRDWKIVFDRKGGLGNLYWQLKYPQFKDEIAPMGLDLSEPKTIYPKFIHGADGGIDVAVIQTKTKQTELNQLYGLQHFLNSDFARSLIELADFQQEKMSEISVEFEEYKREICADIAEEYGAPILQASGNGWILYDWPKSDKEEIFASIKNELENVASDFRKRMIGVLLPAQKKAMTESKQRMQVRYFGAFADIENGELGALLAFTDEQKESLRTNAKKAIDLIESKTRQASENFFAEITKELDALTKRRLKRLLGPPLKAGHFNINNLATTMYFDASFFTDLKRESRTVEDDGQQK